MFSEAIRQSCVRLIGLAARPKCAISVHMSCPVSVPWFPGLGLWGSLFVSSLSLDPVSQEVLLESGRSEVVGMESPSLPSSVPAVQCVLPDQAAMDHLQAPATDQLVHQLAKAPQLLGQPPPADESKAKQVGSLMGTTKPP